MSDSIAGSTAAGKQPSIIVSGLALAMIAVFAAGCGKGSKAQADDPANAPHAAVVKVARRNLGNNLEIASEFLPYQEIDVYAKVSGYIRKLQVDWGTHVKQGQVLAILEIPELEEQIQQDSAAENKSAQDIERAREELSRAQSAYKVAHITFQRLADVQKQRPELVAQQDIDIAQGKDAEASASVSAAKDALGAAEQEALAAKAACDKDRAMYAYSRMTAPFDGVVTQISAYTGALLPAGTSSNKGDSALCHLSQINMLRLVIPVPERAVANIHAGQDVAVTVSALKRTFTGQIARFSQQIDPATRTMHTEVNVPNANYELVPGMYASVQIPLHSAMNVLSVPVQAVQAGSNGEGHVLVVDASNHIERRDVKTGLQTANEIEILSGLKENESVIFGEQSQYRPGQLVTPKLIEPAGME